jgi:hypothetical protein
MVGESIAGSENWLNFRLTATPSTAGRVPPTTCPVTNHLLELHQECVDNVYLSMCAVLGVWWNGKKKLTFFCKMTAPAATPPSSPPSERR